MTETEHSATNRLSNAADPRVGLALGTVLAWTLLEVALRRGVVPALGEAVGSVAAADWTVLLVGFPAMAALLIVVARRRGRTLSDWDYERSLRSVGAGLGGVVVAVVALAGTAYVDSVLFGAGETGAAFQSAVADALGTTPALAVLFLLGNGLAVPVAEEAVWRGVVQTDLVDAWGAVAGVGVTAALFALKHVVVDGSVARLTTLVVLAVLLGAIRHRYGTLSSTITHVGVNALSTAALVAAALA